MNNLSPNISNYTAINNTNNNIKKFKNIDNVNNNKNSQLIISSDSKSSQEDAITELNDIKNEITMRNLCPTDISDLKTLCTEWFPVDYPESWYNDITSSKRFYSIAAIYKDQIVGMIVAEIKTKQVTDREDWPILSNSYSENTQMTYILSLGVCKQLRRLGIASMLVDTLLNYLNSLTDCKAIYLHVMCSNKVAINFYEKKNFEQRVYLPNYYTINGQLHDGYCYVLYMNNGQPPWSMTYPFLKIIRFIKQNFI